jgi:DNA invertase Pin-like site-specific DNA recombinase
MKIFYARVSHYTQNLARQEEMAKQQQVDKVYLEKCSGKNTNREQLQEMLNFVRQGDIIIVESISRFARNTKDFLHLMDILNEKQVAFISLKEKIDTSTPQGKLITTIFAALSEFEREQTLERVREGVAIAKEQGKYKGKPKMKIERENEFIAVCKEWRQGKCTARAVMEEFNLKPNTFYRRVKEMGL